VARLICPACKSEISGDGATLHAMSKYLEELIETAGDVSKLEEALGKMEEKLQAARQESERLKVESSKSKTEGKANVEESGKTKRDGWW